MTLVQALLLAFVAIGGASVVLTHDAKNQALVYSFYGLLLTLLFSALQTPNPVVLGVAVGIVAISLMILLALARVRERVE